MKKLVTIFILIALISSMFAVKGFAAEYTDIINDEQSEMLEILSAYNILGGYSDGTFRPGNCVTRAEVAKIATILIGYDEFTKGMTSTFTDVKGHWAERYVEIIDELGILKGYENNTYEPNKYITYTETVVAILKVLGYNDSVLDDNYPENYHNLAKQLGLFKDINNPSIYMTRESLATLVYNALYANTVSIKNGVTTVSNKQLINNIGKKETVKIDDNFALMHPYIDLTDYMLNTCDVYFDIYGKILLVKNPVYKSIDGYVKSALSTNVVFLSDSMGNTKLYNLSDVPVVFNGIKSKIANEDLNNSYLKLLIDNDDPNKIIGAVATKATDEVIIDSNSLYKEGSATFAGKHLPKKDGKVSLDKVKVIGAVDSIYDIKSDDVVYFYETSESNDSKSTLTIKVVRNSVSGIYNGKGNIMYENFYTLDNTNYKLSNEFKLTESLAEGDKIKAILDENNKIIKVNILKYNKEPETYALVLSVTQGTKDLPSVKILNQQGKVVTYTLRENSGEVTKKIVNNIPLYYTSLDKHSFVKYDKYDNNSIKIIKKMNSTNIASNYSNSTGALTNQNNYINANTVIIQLNNYKYDIINKSSLGYYVEGKAVINSGGVAEIFLLEKNVIKTGESSVVEETPATNTFSGSPHGVIQTIGTDTVKLYNSNDTYSVSKNLNKSLKNYKNKFVKLTVVNNVVTDIVEFSPEISKSKVTAIYNGQLQIDGISYVEYSNNVSVYTCTYDASGNITSFKKSSINDVKINSSVQFYNINNNYNGVMDVIIINN